jgi:serpin B
LLHPFSGALPHPGALRPQQRQRFSMIVDRPFDCAIVDNQTGALLFLGSIVEPE